MLHLGIGVSILVDYVYIFVNYELIGRNNINFIIDEDNDI